MDHKKYEKLNFNHIYKEKGYPQNIWPILNEYFSRYKHEFDLVDVEVNSKLFIITNNLDSIKIAGTTKNSYLGEYSSSQKNININLKLMKKMGINEEEILNTIFHELNHVGENLNTNYDTSFQKYNYDTESFEGTALNEIITEMKSSRLAKNDRINNKKCYLDLIGYGDLIFIGTMIHTALGISEKDFLKYTELGKYSFDCFMRSKFPSQEDYDSFINNITFYSDMLHTIKYNRENPKLPYTQEELDNLNNSISGIYDNCLYAMGKTIPYQALKNKDDINMKEYMTKCRFNLEKLNINYYHGMSYIFDTNYIDSSQNSYLTDLQNKILAIETIDLSKDKLTSEQYSEILSSMFQTNLHGVEHLANIYDNYGIAPYASTDTFERTMDLEYEIQILKEEYGQSTWDNTNVKELINNFTKNDNIFIKLFNKLKNSFNTKLPTSLPAFEIETRQSCFYYNF